MQPTPSSPPTPAKPHKEGATPARDPAQAAAWVSMAAAWKKNPQLTLVYTTQAAFEAAALAFAAHLQARQAADAPRGPLSNRLTAIRDQFAEALPYIKSALLPIFKKAGVEAAYPGFGIGRHDGGWQFSADRLLQQDDYDKCVAGLRAQGLTTGDYGADTLAPLAQEFRATYARLVALDADTSQAVGQKNQGKPYLKKVAKSLRRLLEANYPDTYAQELRTWGLQKEKF